MWKNVEGSNSQCPLFEKFIFRAEDSLKSKLPGVIAIDLSKHFY
jgi:hypothetical protein